jgi:exopolyphosphatase/guanosine-5'-triphosphate,3'-diphosphate pyrophosphatase
MKKAKLNTFRIAAFDFGSNAMKCLIAEHTSKGLTYLQEYRYQNRLGSSIDIKGNISQTAIDDTIMGAKKLLHKCNQHEVNRYLAVGTEALRKAVNTTELVSRLYAETGLDLQIISPDREANLAWRGVIGGLDAQYSSILLVDSGGSSTELIYGSTDRIADICSVPLGAVNLAKSCIKSDPISDAEYNKLHGTIAESFEGLSTNPEIVIGVGGGFTACAKVAMGKDDYPALMNALFPLTRDELIRQINLLRYKILDERKQIPGMEADRADILIVSALIALRIIDLCQTDSMYISVRGLRHGLINSMLPAIS